MLGATGHFGLVFVVCLCRFLWLLFSSCVVVWCLKCLAVDCIRRCYDLIDCPAIVVFLLFGLLIGILAFVWYSIWCFGCIYGLPLS